MLRAWSIKMVAMTRLELVTPALWVRCSNQLSYIAVNCARIMWFSHQYVKYLARLIDQNLLKWADKPGSVENDHSSRRTITHTLKRPTRIQHGPCLMDSYLVLLPVGFTMPWTVTSHAVRSYRTLSPLPLSRLTRRSVAKWRSTLCCTFRRLSPPRRYLAPCPMKPGLSSPASITEISTAAIVWLTSRRIVSNLRLNCLRFFEQSAFYIYPWAHPQFPHD